MTPNLKTISRTFENIKGFWRKFPYFRMAKNRISDIENRDHGWVLKNVIIWEIIIDTLGGINSENVKLSVRKTSEKFTMFSAQIEDDK